MKDKAILKRTIKLKKKPFPYLVYSLGRNQRNGIPEHHTFEGISPRKQVLPRC